MPPRPATPSGRGPAEVPLLAPYSEFSHATAILLCCKQKAAYFAEPPDAPCAAMSLHPTEAINPANVESPRHPEEIATPRAKDRPTGRRKSELEDDSP